VGAVLSQHQIRSDPMRKLALAIATCLMLPLAAIAADAETIELKDGGKIVLEKDGKTYHVDANGKRVRMKDGVVMEAKDGRKYLMKNDAIWRQISEKGTLAPNR